MNKKNLFVRIFLALVLVFSSTAAFAQESDWYYNKPIKYVTFKGLNSIKKSDLDGITASFNGKKFDDQLFADLLNRLFSLDYFDDIMPQALPGDSKYSSVEIQLTVVEKPLVSKILFSGNNRIRSNDLASEIKVKEKDIYRSYAVLSDERLIRDYYISKGYTTVRVTSSAENTEDGVVLTFHINEGQQTVVGEINFEGNQVVSSKTLKSKISLKEVGFLGKGSFQESALEADKQTIVAYYQNRGYVDAKILDVTRELSYNEEKARDELKITFVLQEGSQYNFGGITFEGNQVFSTETLNALIKIKEGTLFNQAKFQESLMAVEDLYYENGYTYNAFLPQVEKNTDTKTISFRLNITENPRSHIENVIIKGNTKTKDYIIRRELPMESGDIFSKAKITSGLRNLYNLQFFSAVVPEIIQGSEEGLVDVVYSVEEQSTTTLDFGFTFSGVTDPDELPVALYVKIQDSNLFGEGKSVSASTTLSTEEQSVDLSYSQNWLFGLPIGASVSLGYSHSNANALRNKLDVDGNVKGDSYYMEFEQHSFNLSGMIGHRWSFDWALLSLNGGITGSLVNNIYDGSIYVPLDSNVSHYNNNWAPKNSIFASASLDNRNISADPTAGWFFSERLAWYGLLPKGVFAFAPEWGETEFYLRSDSKFEYYWTLVDKPVSDDWAFHLTLMAYSGLSVQLPVPGTIIKDTNKLYIDGMFNGRGWYIYNNASRRGSFMWTNSLELRWPFIPNILALDIFVDAVNVSKTAQDFFAGQNQADNWYFSFGPSLRFAIPQFPLRLLLCNTFHVEDGQVKFVDKYCSEQVPWYKNWNFVLSFNIANR